MALGQLPGDGEAQARPIGAAGPAEGLKQMLPHPGRHAWAVIGQAQAALTVSLVQGDRDDAVAPVRLLFDGLAGVAHQIDQDPVQLVGIGKELVGGAQG